MAVKAIKAQQVESTITGNWGASKPGKNRAGNNTPGREIIGMVELVTHSEDGGSPSKVPALVALVTWDNGERGTTQSLEFVSCFGSAAEKNRAAHQKGLLEKVCQMRAARTDYIFSHCNQTGELQYSKVGKSSLAFMYTEEGDCLGTGGNALEVIGARVAGGELVAIIDATSAPESQDLLDLI